RRLHPAATCREGPASWVPAQHVVPNELLRPKPSCVATSPHGHAGATPGGRRSEEHTSELQSRFDLVCRLLLEKKKKQKKKIQEKKKKKITIYVKVITHRIT